MSGSDVVCVFYYLFHFIPIATPHFILFVRVLILGKIHLFRSSRFATVTLFDYHALLWMIDACL
jgi:hypothetical protein